MPEPAAATVNWAAPLAPITVPSGAVAMAGGELTVRVAAALVVAPAGLVTTTA